MLHERSNIPNIDSKTSRPRTHAAFNALLMNHCDIQNNPGKVGPGGLPARRCYCLYPGIRPASSSTRRYTADFEVHSCRHHWQNRLLHLVSHLLFRIHDGNDVLICFDSPVRSCPTCWSLVNGCTPRFVTASFVLASTCATAPRGSTLFCTVQKQIR
jgi:hypothetical protein